MEYSNKYPFLLNSCPLLNGLPKAGITELLYLFEELKWPKHSCLIDSKKLSDYTYVIVYGRVKMYQTAPNGKEMTIFLLTKGDIFDLFCLLDGQKHNVYYECVDDVKVLAAPMQKVKKWLDENPGQYRHLLSYAGKQLRLLETYVSDITFTDISTRLLKLLVGHTNKSSRLELINDMSNKDLAQMIGTTGAVINRHLQKLKRSGSIKLSRNRLEVEDLGLLLHLLDEENKKLKG